MFILSFIEVILIINIYKKMQIKIRKCDLHNSWKKSL